ncbi:MAG: ABC transporter ATP-binding protein [Clostridia bacterium]
MIEVKNVTKKYGDFTAIDHISFEVKDGEVVGFLGPNGAGKSTTMNMITGFIEPTEGQIIVNGNDISKKAIKAKKQIGYMPENVPLYQELTVKEFVKYMAELKRVDAKQRKLQIEEILKETGLEEVQNKLIKNLSRGYKQRVSLAGALMGKPDVLILDEPTVGLDPKQIIEIRNLIKELGKNHTVILSTHILSEVSQVCEKVIIINHGKIIAIDTPEHLEEKTKEKNVLLVTVEDKQEHMQQIKEKVENILELKMVKDNQDGTKQYMITSKADIDLRKTLFDILPKLDITIFELKKAEATLEDAFIRLVKEEGKEEVVKNKEPKKKKEKKSKEGGTK